MKKSLNQNSLGVLDWALSIDFDPVAIIHVGRGMQAAYASVLDKKEIKPKGGD